MKSSFSVEPWALDEITPYAQNPRNIPQSAILKVAASIKTFGWRQPIVVDETGVILVGHTRLLAALHINDSQCCIFDWSDCETAPVHVMAGLSEFDKKAYRITDNRTGEETSWNDEILSKELQSLDEADFRLDTLGFDFEELANLLDGLEEDDGLLPLSSHEGQATVRTPVLKWGRYKVALSENEKTELDALAKQWSDENGMLHGFVQGCLLKGQSDV